MSGNLTHPPSDIIRQLLIDEGQGTSPADGSAWPIHVSQEPNAPDSVITIYDTTGKHSGRAMVGGEVFEHHGVQVRVRDANPKDGFTKSRAILVAMDEDVSYDAVTIDGTGYIVYAISRTSGVIPLGKEPTSKRNLFTINVLVALRQTT